MKKILLGRGLPTGRKTKSCGIIAMILEKSADDGYVLGKKQSVL
ncbi:MAG: hypothetical protein ABIW38_13570 [Ferruginibacter sp.]